MLKKLGRIIVNVNEKDLDLEALLQSPYSYEEGLIKLVEHGEIADVYGYTDILAKEGQAIVKVEGLEKLNVKLFESCRELGTVFGHSGPITCHLFRSPMGAESFSMHTDPDDVVIYMVKGQKVFEHDHGTVLVKEGEALSIPRGERHRAINIEDTLMLSFGLERFIVEKL